MTANVNMELALQELVVRSCQLSVSRLFTMELTSIEQNMQNAKTHGGQARPVAMVQGA